MRVHKEFPMISAAWGAFSSFQGKECIFLALSQQKLDYSLVVLVVHKLDIHKCHDRYIFNNMLARSLQKKNCFKKLLKFQTASSSWQLSDGITVGWFNPVTSWSLQSTLSIQLWLFIVERIKEVMGTLCTVLQEMSQTISSRCYS